MIAAKNQNLLANDPFYGDSRTETSHFNSRTESHSRTNSISGVILVPLPGQIAIPRSISILQSMLIPPTAPKSALKLKSSQESESIPTSQSGPELIPNPESKSGRYDSELPPLVYSHIY